MLERTLHAFFLVQTNAKEERRVGSRVVRAEDTAVALLRSDLQDGPRPNHHRGHQHLYYISFALTLGEANDFARELSRRLPISDTTGSSTRPLNV